MAIWITNPSVKPRLTNIHLKHVLRIFLNGIGLSKAHVSLTLTDNSEIHLLNQTWRNKDKPTDVLSFPQSDITPKTVHLFENKPVLLGDIIISRETAYRQALQQKRTFEAEMHWLIVHGLLHLVGHDHIHGGIQARRMRLEEQRLLRLLKSP